MPSLQQATISNLDETTITPRSATYTGTIDATWCIGSVPQGGYSLSIILNAVLAFMRTPEARSTNVKSISHLDPLVLSATYIQAVSCIPFCVRIQVLKRGKSLSNLQADLYQEDVLRITTQVLMTDFQVQRSSADRTKAPHMTAKDLHNPIKNGYSITEKSQWAPGFPLSPPEQCDSPRKFGRTEASGKTVNFGDMVTISVDPKHVRSSQQTNRLSAGAYYALIPQPRPTLDPAQVETGRTADGATLLPFLADMFLSPPMMIPGRHKSHWYPTLHLTIEFKRALPRFVERTATLSTGRWMINGQHESDTELWSHPDDQAMFEADPKCANKRERRSYILAIARQTALVLPFAVNQAKQGRVKGKL